MSTSAPLPPEPGTLTPSFAAPDDAGSTLGWRQARLRAITAVRAQDWPGAWQAFQQALSDLPSEEAAHAVGLRADLSHCDWLSGHQAQALRGFAGALERAEALADDGQRARLMAVIALVVAGLNQEMAGETAPDAERLLPGTCSDTAHWPDAPTPPALAWLQLLRLEERLGQADLFRRHGQPLAAADNPLIRWYYRQLAIRKLVRDDEPQALLSHAIACGRAFRAVQEAPDAESGTLDDRMDPLEMPILATSVLPPLLASLILQQGGRDLVGLIEGWLGELAEPSPESGLREWLQGVLAIMRQSPETAWEQMQDPDQPLDARLVAGLRALSVGLTLERLFFMHCLVALWAAQPEASLGANLLQSWFPELARRAWQLMGAAHPALQAMPEIAEPLLRVCLKPAPGWAGVRQILQTAQPAVRVSLSPAVLDAFAILLGETRPKEEPPEGGSAPAPTPGGEA